MLAHCQLFTNQSLARLALPDLPEACTKRTPPSRELRLKGLPFSLTVSLNRTGSVLFSLLELPKLENLFSELDTPLQKRYGIPHSAGLVQLRAGIPNRSAQRPPSVENSGIAEGCGCLQ